MTDLQKMIEDAIKLAANHTGESAEDLRERWRQAFFACTDQELWLLPEMLGKDPE